MTQLRRRRRPGVAETVGLVVEGETEFEALPSLHRQFPSKCPPLKPLNLHGVGSHLDAGGVAKLVAPHVHFHQVAGRRKVIVCIDREQRDRCAPGFASDVAAALRTELSTKVGASVDDVHVVIADRAFEAWLLAGALAFFGNGVFKVKPKFGCFEGKLGERQSKGAVELGRLLGRPYSKTGDGPRLFEALDFAAARCWRNGRGSRSLDKLLRTLGV